jgi:hypothetical protein
VLQSSAKKRSEYFVASRRFCRFCFVFRSFFSLFCRFFFVRL